MTDPALSAEFAFVAACCRWPQTDEIARQARAIVAAGIDWRRALQLSERHRVTGLLHNAMHAFGIAPPPEASAQFANEGRAIARQNLLAAHEMLTLQRQFEAAGIPVLMLKGLSLAQRVYGSIDFKQSRDVDLLVRPEDALNALASLEARGYALADPAKELSAKQRRAFVARGHELEVVRKDGLRVELHWRLSGNPYLVDGIEPFLDSQTVGLPGGSVRTLRDADLFAYLCVHGASHNWFRLKWLADVEALLASMPEDEVARLYAYAQTRGAGVCAGQALLLSSRLLGRQLSEDLCAKLKRDRRTVFLAELAMRRIAGIDRAAEVKATSFEQGKQLGLAFLHGRGVRFYAKQCELLLVAPADVIRWTLPSALGFMYPLLRLPSWLLRRLSALVPRRTD